MSAVGPRVVAALGTVFVGCWALALFWAMEHRTYDLWGVLLVVPVLALVSVPLAVRAARADGAPGILGLLGLAMLAKLVGCMARYAMAFVLYGGSADAARYDEHGSLIAEQLRSGQLALGDGDITGTRFVEVVTGFVYAVTGPSLTVAYVVFAYGALWGQWFFYRAFRTALPDVPGRRYARLVLLWPSIVFWPASVGKESVMILALGLASLGAARIYVGRVGGVVPLVLGTGLATLVRPHMGMLVGVCVAAGLLVRRPRNRTALTPVIQLVGLAAAAGAVVFLVMHAAEFFGVDDPSSGSVQDVLDSTAQRTAVGGSAFDAHVVRTPLDLPIATVNVLLRPFPWEATNAALLISAVEGLALTTLLALSWRRLATVPRLFLKQPYVAMMTSFVLLFVVAFSTFGNFGLLARERVQVLPMLLALASLPAGRRASPAPRPADRITHPLAVLGGPR